MGLEKVVEKGKMKKEEAEEAFKRINTTVNLKEVCKNADYIIEAVPENMELKKEIFRKLDENSRENVILASNTSSLPIIEIAAATNRPEKVIGMHFFQPVAVMKLVEMVKGLLTSDETVEISKDLANKLGRVIAVVKDTGTGFPSIRLSRALAMEAFKLLEEEQYKMTGDPIWRPPPILKQLLMSGYKGNKERWGGRGGFYEFFRQKREK